MLLTHLNTHNIFFTGIKDKLKKFIYHINLTRLSKHYRVSILNLFSKSHPDFFYCYRLVILSGILWMPFLFSCNDKSADEYLTEAKLSLKNKTLYTATIDLKNALKAEPSLAEARFLLGKFISIIISITSLDDC